MRSETFPSNFVRFTPLTCEYLLVVVKCKYGHCETRFYLLLRGKGEQAEGSSEFMMCKGSIKKLMN